MHVRAMRHSARQTLVSGRGERSLDATAGNPQSAGDKA